MTTQVKIPVYFLRAVADNELSFYLAGGTKVQYLWTKLRRYSVLFLSASTVGVNGTRGDDNALSKLAANRRRTRVYRNLRTPCHTVYTKTKFPGISRLKFH